MFYSDQEVLELLRKMPEEKKRLIASELTIKGYDVETDLVPALKVYLNSVDAALNHAKSMYSILLPQILRQVEQMERNEAALGLEPSDSAKKLRSAMKVESAKALNT